jgi:hypothetical protein
VPEFVSSTHDMEVVLNNVPLRTLGPVGFDLVNVYGRKVHQGDPQPNDHPTDSTITQESHQGGIGTLVYRGDEDRGNSWFSMAWMQTSRVLSLPPKTYTHTQPTTEEDLAWVHGEIDGKRYVSFGTAMQVWNEVTDTFDNTVPNTILSAFPIGGGVSYTVGGVTKIYIPTGSAYQIFTGTGASAGVGAAIAFEVWSQKLFKLSGAGDVHFSTNGTSWTLVGNVTDGSTPRGLFVFYDRSNNQTLHVATSSTVYALDFTNQLLIETDLQYPNHPTQGLGSCRWRADAYVTVGLGIHRQAGGLITSVGPDGRDGLPEEYQEGYFTSLAPSYNELFGLLAGAAIDPLYEDEYDLVAGLPDPTTSDTQDRFSMLMGFNGLGWHPRWVGQREPTNVRVGSTGGIYRVFWGDRGHIHTQILPTGYYNPSYRQQHVPMERFVRHETPYYNWGMVNTPKILKYFETHTSNCDENNYIRVWVRTDDNAQWGDGTSNGTPLATITTNGQHRMLIGYETFGNRTLHAGMEHERVQFAFEFFGNAANEYETPVMDWYTIVGRKWMRTVRVFTFQVDATTSYDGLSADLISEHLYQAARKKGGVPLVIADRVFMVDVSADSGNIAAGMTWEAYHNISCVEMIEEDNE